MPHSPPRNPAALQLIFKKLKMLLQAYSPPLVARGVRTDKPQYHLWSLRSVVVAGRRKKEFYFAGAIIQKAYVGFYYMPVYTNDEVRKLFAPELLALLKGKSCFYIRELSPRLERQIRKALRIGFRKCKQNGWI
jgi:hypothetical protein